MSWPSEPADIADEVPRPARYNLKLGTLFGLPSRFISRMRRVSRIIRENEEGRRVVSFGRTEWGSTGSNPPPPTFQPLPGPWGFMTSGYALGLFFMAILLNRIQNIVVPPRQMFASRLARNSRHPTSVLRMIYDFILPVDFSSTPSRFIFRIPTLYFLCKSLLIWTVILLQTADHFPSWKVGFGTLGNWVADKEMEDVCWSTFCAVCGALCVGALTRGLEGSIHNTSPNSAPFNMFGYAFLLHIYASPITHSGKLQDLPSRPNKHIIVTIILPLLQLTMSHVLGVKQRWSHHRLVPTAIASILGLIHFHAVLWFSPSSYPLLNYMPCLFESLLAVVTLLTISLNALTQLLLEGAITRPLFGHAATLLPKWDEDFSIVLLRLGTASLEATSVAGLGNEVGTVLSNTKNTAQSHVEYGTVEVSRSGVTSLSPTVEGKGKRKKVKEGLANEIKHVKAGPSEGEVWVDMAWYRELAKFGIGVGKCAKGLWRLLYGAVRGKREIQAHSPTRASSYNDDDDEEKRPAYGGGHGDEIDIYERFLRGDGLSDDDEDFDPDLPSHTTSTSHTPSTRSDTPDFESDDNAAGETIGLYSDLASATGPSASAPLLLAHMTDSSSSPLTRRRYGRLVDGPGHRPAAADEVDGWPNQSTSRWVAESTAQNYGTTGQVNEDSFPEHRRNCVVCTVEPREIICWPCRCLALCDDCRENLASRSSSSKHKCPCCRRNVEGYSRIFIP